MNRSQLSEAVAKKTGMSKTQVQKIIVECQKTAADVLRRGDKLTVSGFGTFSISHSAARVGRNPRTGEAVRIAPKRSVKFRSSFEL